MPSKIYIYYISILYNSDTRGGYAYLLDSDSGFPGFFLVKDGEADCAGWIDIRMKERWREFACSRC